METIGLLAVGLTLLLFLLWWFIGYGVVFVLRRRCLLQNALLAPAVGSAVCLMFVFWLNRAGLPVARFGLALGVSLVIGSALLWWRGRVIVPIRQYLPFAAVLLLALLLVGWPMFEFGFNWVSISNDDMANYCLMAQRVLDYGFFDGLPVQELAKNKDMSAYYWYMHVKAGVRPGSELLLAFVMTLTKLSSHQVFMPVILALHLSLLSAAGAFTLRRGMPLGWVLMALLILSFSAEFALGTIYQLIAQVYGLSLGAAIATLVMFQPRERPRRSILKAGLLIAIVFGAMMVVYTEVVPLIGLGCALYWTHAFLKTRMIAGIRAYIIGLLLTIVFLNSYIPYALGFMFRQAQVASGHPEGVPVLFPFFLLPSGAALFWGLLPLNTLPSEPLLSSCIFLGIVLLIIAFAGTVWEAWNGVPVAFVCLSMAIAAVVLATKEADFAMFKIAMYIQPFLIPTLVGAWMRITGKTR